MYCTVLRLISVFCCCWFIARGVVCRFDAKMAAFREDVVKLRELAAQRGEARQALRDRDDTIRGEL